MPDRRDSWIIRRAEILTGESFARSPVVFDDTTNYMYIDRGHFIRLEGELFLVRGNEREARFGLGEQPKFWVKRTLSLDDGRRYILKLVCQEAFKVQIGVIQVTCVRSGEKEGRVLDLVRGDRRFMQGRTVRDTRGNPVRIIEFINGNDLLSHLDALALPHEQYFYDHFPALLDRAVSAFEGIGFLNDHGLCHGDIRNDHILIDSETAQFRWIDYDLTQDFTDFDLWSLGNILHCLVARGFVNFSDVIRERPELSGRLGDDDASAFFPHRVMNLGKIYPYLPAKLNEILLRFSQGTRVYYDSIHQIVEDLEECRSDR